MKRARLSSLGLFALGAGVALLYLGLVQPAAIVGDASDYDRLGWWLAHADFFSLDGVHASAFRPPIYPFFVSIVYRIFGHLPAAVLAAQALLCGGTAVLLSSWLRLDCTEKRSRWAGVACAVYPVLVAYAAYLLSETLFTFLLTLGAWLYRRSENSSTNAAASGLVFGLAALTRSLILYFPFFWIIALWLRSRRLPRTALLWLGVYLAALVPWTVRNVVRFGVVMPVSVGGGYALWAGAQPGHYPDAAKFESFVAPYARDSVSGDQLATSRALKMYWSNLPRIILDLPRRTLHFWLTSHSAIFGYSESLRAYWDARDVSGVLVKMGGFLLQVVLLSFAAYGVARIKFRSDTLFPIAIVLYTWILVVITDYGPNRYHVPLIPILIYVGTRGSVSGQRGG